MLFDDTYQTIRSSAGGMFKDRGSKFLAFAYPVNTEGEWKNILAALKALHPKANHHCWALRLTTDRSVFRINDDGEPSGTAGRPILNTLLSRNLTNAGVIVVRYFGGTLLGVPGLINAYKSAAEEALNNAEVIQKTVDDIYSLEFDYLQMNDVMRIIKNENLNVISQNFDAACSLRFSVRKTMVNAVTQQLSKLDGISLKYEYTT